MKKRLACGAAALVAAALLTSCAKEPADPASLAITSIQKLNAAEPVVNDHAEDWQYSQLEPNFREYVELQESVLKTNVANYPRIKKVTDDRYLLFYQDAQTAKNIYYTSSTDLQEWEFGKKLFSSRNITVNGENDTLCFSTCDALVLQNGDIMAIASFRSGRNFRRTNEYNGLMMRISSDGGETWGEEQIIYKGSNWEPQILQLPSREIQVYFTHGGPKIQPQMEAGIPTSEMVPSSGTAIIRSYDNGQTWDPYVMEPPYAAWRVSQQYTHTKNGIKVFTDQMPCAILLNNTNTIALATESKFLEGNEEVYYITMAYSDDNWAQELGIDEEGPADKQENMYLGAAPYLKQFPSGETILSNNRQSKFQIRLGDSLARDFGDPINPLAGTGYWGSLEVIRSHTVVGTMAYARKLGDKNQNRIMISQNYLNHRIDVPEAEIAIDGSNTEWAAYTDALFVGSDSQAQVSVRPVQDEENVSFLLEVLDSDLNQGDAVELYLSAGEGETLDETSFRLTVEPDGTVETARFDGTDFAAVEDAAVKSAVTLQGTVGDGGEDTGYLAEVSIPRSLLGADGGTLRCHIVLHNQDTGAVPVEDKLGESRWNVPGEWMPLALG